ncbi:translation initiation factor eIF 4e-like domain-containing protein [Cunninghamella echinulata]|nr:translation initiation factor eIF 4e-like domain-containing protein [Cunninghamella echinulata]
MIIGLYNLNQENNGLTEKKENAPRQQQPTSPYNIPNTNTATTATTTSNISLSPAVSAFQQFWPSSSSSSPQQQSSMLNKKPSFNNINNNNNNSTYIATKTGSSSSHIHSSLSTSPSTPSMMVGSPSSINSPLHKYSEYKGNVSNRIPDNNNNNNTNPSSSPSPSSLHIKDGYIYKDKVVILDQEKKEQLLKVGTIQLQGEWTYWYDRYVPNLPASEYEANLQIISTVGTVQKFWSVYNNIDGPEKLSFRSNLHFMRKGIKPIWEDPKNEYGGSYYFKINKQQSPIVWRDILVLFIGEKIEQWLDDIVYGVSVSSRQHCDNYQIWISTGQDKNDQDGKIKKALSDLLSPVEIQSFYFKVHKNHAAFQKDGALTGSNTSNGYTKYNNNSNNNNNNNNNNNHHHHHHQQQLNNNYNLNSSNNNNTNNNNMNMNIPHPPIIEMHRKITEESIEKVVADIERLNLKQKSLRKMNSKNSISNI